MRHLIMACALLAAASCGVQPTEMASAGDPAVARRYLPPTTIYFMRDGRLAPVQRRSLPGAPEVALDQLFKGPTGQERNSGLRTYIPAGAVVLRVRPPSTFFISLPWSTLGPHGLAQIVCTGDAQPGIDKVTLVFGTERTSLTCADYWFYK